MKVLQKAVKKIAWGFPQLLLTAGRGKYKKIFGLQRKNDNILASTFTDPREKEKNRAANIPKIQFL